MHISNKYFPYKQIMNEELENALANNDVNKARELIEQGEFTTSIPNSCNTPSLVRMIADKCNENQLESLTNSLLDRNDEWLESFFYDYKLVVPLLLESLIEEDNLPLARVSLNTLPFVRDEPIRLNATNQALLFLYNFGYETKSQEMRDLLIEYGYAAYHIT